MFNSITGIITEKSPQHLCIETLGIEWDIVVPDNVLEKVPDVGKEARVFTWLNHTDVQMCLYGFASAQDRTLFFDLLKVDGIGPKAALKIISNVSPSALMTILEKGDLDTLQKVPGVGKKTAAKMLLQLKGKLSLLEENTASPGTSGKQSAFSNVVSALVTMGYEKKNAEEAVDTVLKKISNEEQFSALSTVQKEDAVFRNAIVELAQ